MNASDLYKCLADDSRLRILVLLSHGPLCGCHLIEALGLDQVKVSKQLNYMRRMGILSAEREANWMIYRLVEIPLLMDNIAALQRHPPTSLPLNSDHRKLTAIMRRIANGKDLCPQLVTESTAMACCASR